MWGPYKSNINYLAFCQSLAYKPFNNTIYVFTGVEVSYLLSYKHIYLENNYDNTNDNTRKPSIAFEHRVRKSYGATRLLSRPVSSACGIDSARAIATVACVERLFFCLTEHGVRYRGQKRQGR